MTEDQKPSDASEIVVSDSSDNPTPTEEAERLMVAEDQRPEPEDEDG